MKARSSFIPSMKAAVRPIADQSVGITQICHGAFSIVQSSMPAVKIVIVPIPADVIAKVGDPAYQPATIPANTYNGQSDAAATVAIPNFLVTHEGVPADTVYAMAKSMFDNLDQMVAAHAAAKAIKRENALNGMPLPLHAGAEKYYREVGLIK